MALYDFFVHSIRKSINIEHENYLHKLKVKNCTKKFPLFLDCSSLQNHCWGYYNHRDNSLQQHICWFNLGRVRILVFSNKKKKCLLKIFYASGSGESLSWKFLTLGNRGLYFRIKLLKTLTFCDFRYAPYPQWDLL